MIKKTVDRLSDYIVDGANLNKAKKDKIRFGLEIIVSSIISLITILMISSLFRLTNLVIFIVISSALLKLIAGGIHFKTIGECALISAIFYNLTAFLGRNMEQILVSYKETFFLIAAVYILGILFFWSPAPVENKPTKNPEQKRKLKLISIITAIIILILSYYNIKQYRNMSIGLLMGLMLHVFTITPLAYYLHNKYYFIKTLYKEK